MRRHFRRTSKLQQLPVHTRGLLGASLRPKSGICRPMKNSLGRDGIKELVKVVVSAKDDKVLGFHMVGSEASEIMQVCC